MTDLFDLAPLSASSGEPEALRVSAGPWSMTWSGARMLVVESDKLYAAWKASPQAGSLTDWIKANRALIQSTLDGLNFEKGTP